MKANPATEEERLLIEAAQRNPGRFAELYERNFDLVYAYVARRVGSRAEAEDVTAEVFQQALANLPRFEWRGVAFAAWLRRMAANARQQAPSPSENGSGAPPILSLGEPFASVIKSCVLGSASSARLA